MIFAPRCAEGGGGEQGRRRCPMCAAPDEVGIESEPFCPRPACPEAVRSVDTFACGSRGALTVDGIRAAIAIRPQTVDQVHGTADAPTMSDLSVVYLEMDAVPS
jgi:hypothetical protein